MSSFFIRHYSLSYSRKTVIYGLIFLWINVVVMACMHFSEWSIKIENAFIIVQPIGLIIILVCVLYHILKYFFFKLDVYDDKVVISQLFNKDEIYISNFRGYRIEKDFLTKYARFLPQKAGMPEKWVPIIMDDPSSFEDWIRDIFGQIPDDDYQYEYELIIPEDRTPAVVERREKLLSRARSFSRIVKIISYIILGWGFIFPVPYVPLMWFIMITPFFVVILGALYPRMFCIDKFENYGPVLSSMNMLLFPCFVLFHRIMMDYSFYEYKQIALYASIPALLLFVAIMFAYRKSGKVLYGTIFFLALICYAYGNFTVFLINCMHDKSEAAIFHTTVMAKSSTTGRFRMMMITTAPWGPDNISSSFSVGFKTYINAKKGDPVTVYYMNGLFGIPWSEAYVDAESE